MAARAQTTCYPFQTLQAACNKCNTNMSTSCADGDNATQPCSAVCNTCNTGACIARQAYCSIGHQMAISHSDIPKNVPWTNCITQNEMIGAKTTSCGGWNAQHWNKATEDIQTAFNVGKTQKQGSIPNFTQVVADVCNNTHPANSLITANLYNEWRTALANIGSTLAAVSPNDPIKTAHAAAQVTAYNGMRFNTSVCDICNAAGNQKYGPMCSCNCSCPCDCPCDCRCDCPCDCSCDCSCSCSSG